MFNFAKSISFRELSTLYLTISVISALILVFNFVLIFHPLTKVLGYEFSALNSLYLTILSGIFTIKWFKSHSHITKTFLLSIFTFVLIPLIISIINSIISEFCSFYDGILFYITITLPSVLVGSTIGSLVVYVVKRFRVILFLIVVVMIAFIPVIEIYFNPQIYFYNPLIAFFPGTIYDEGMAVDLKLTAYRLLNIILALSFFYLISTDKNQIHKIRNVLFILIICVSFYFTSSFLGFSTSYSKLSGLLSKKIDTSKYLVHYDETLPEQEIELLVLNAEYYYNILEKSVEEKPSQKLEIFLFRNSEQKKLYFGSESADVAKPWLYQIYLSQESWRGTLKHEIAHIFSSEFGSTIFKLAGAFNPFLIEGFATSQDPFKDDIYIDYLSSLYYWQTENSLVSDILGHSGFFNINSLAAYVFSGSFSKYLLENYGINAFKLFYSSNDIIKSYNIPIDTILKNYSIYLSNFQIDKNIHSFHYFFGRKSIIQKVCPRYIGRQIQKGWMHIQLGKYEIAKSHFSDVLAKVPNYSALNGLVECLERQDSLEVAVRLFSSYLPYFKETPYDYLLKLKLADFYAKLSDFSEAKKTYEQLQIERPTINIELLSTMRLRLMESNLLQKYLIGNDSIKFNILDELNRANYFYPSMPSFINLAIATKQDYQSFIRKFDKTLFITDIPSAWTAYKLSQYMIENFDFRNSRKMAALAKRFKERKHLSLLWDYNFEKAEWFYYNADEFLNRFTNKAE